MNDPAAASERLRLRAHQLRATGDHEGALRLIEAASVLNPSPTVLNDRGLWLLKAGHLAEAAYWLRRAVWAGLREAAN